MQDECLSADECDELAETLHQDADSLPTDGGTPQADASDVQDSDQPVATQADRRQYAINEADCAPFDATRLVHAKAT